MGIYMPSAIQANVLAGWNEMSEQALQAIQQIHKKADFYIRSMAQELRRWKEKNLQGADHGKNG